MTRARRIVGLLMLCAAVLGAAWALVPPDQAAGPGLRQLQAWRLVETLQGGTLQAHDGSPAWPYRWDTRHTVDGQADFWFALPVDVERDGPSALLIPRIGHAFQVWRDEQLLADMDAVDRRYLNLSHRPRLVRLPTGPDARDRSDGAPHQLHIRLHALAGTNSGLAGVWIGPVAAVESAQQDLWFWLVYGTLAVGTASVVMGLLALVMWRTGREACYLWYVVAEWAWAARMFGYAMSERTWLPWPWSNALAAAGYSLSLGAIGLFSLTLIGQDARAWRRGIVAWTVTAMAAAVAINATGLHALLMPWRTAMLAFAVVLVIGLVRGVLTQRSRTGHVLLLACAVSVATGARDWYVLTFQRQNYDVMPWIPAAWVLFGGALLWVVGERLRTARLAQADEQARLAAELARQHEALQGSFEVERRQVQRRATDRERQRLLQDMHDGLGGELLAALQLARRADVRPAEVAGQIQQALDQLKLTVDALQDSARDIPTLLGLLRHRLSPRLRDAGITLDWRVDALPEPSHWRSADARDLQLLVHEAFNNLIQHARAHHASLQACLVDDGATILIRITDDGVGLAGRDGKGPSGGQGLAGMQVRADRLGARLAIGDREDGMGGLRTELRLPVVRGVAGE